MFSNRIFLFVLVFISIATVRSGADEPLGPAQILERARAAMGTKPPAFREASETTSADGTIHTVRMRSGSDYRDIVDEGPFHSESGSFGGQSWWQNRNGETVLYPPDPGDVPPEPRTETARRIATPIDGYVVSSLDARGYGEKRYVEAATWRVLREEAVEPDGTTTTTFDDFRTVAGYTLAFTRTTTDGHPEDDRTERIASFEPVAVPASDLAVPPSRRTFVSFPGGKPSVVLPVREDDGKFIVHITVGKRGLDLVLDSGTSGIVLEEGVVKELGLAEKGAVSNGDNAGRYRSASAIVPEMHVGELTLRDVAVDTVPTVSFIAREGEYRAVGLLGFDFFDAAALTLDYERGTVTATDPAAFVPPPPASGGFELGLRLGTGVPLVALDVNGVRGERFLIDTGGAGSLLLFDSFIHRHRAALVAVAGDAERDPIITGIGGEVKTQPFFVKSVVFGSVTFTGFTVPGVVDARDYRTFDGTVGPLFLGVFDVTFDYPHATAYFRFNAFGRKARRTGPAR